MNEALTWVLFCVFMAATYHWSLRRTLRCGPVPRHVAPALVCAARRQLDSGSPGGDPWGDALARRLAE